MNMTVKGPIFNAPKKELCNMMGLSHQAENLLDSPSKVRIVVTGDPAHVRAIMRTHPLWLYSVIASFSAH